MQRSFRILSLVSILALAVALTGCGSTSTAGATSTPAANATPSGDTTGTETPAFAIGTITLVGSPSAKMVALGANVVEVDGMATNTDQYQHDVYISANLKGADGKSVGYATGRIENMPAGNTSAYRLFGPVTASTWMTVTAKVFFVQEHVQGFGG